MRKSNPLNLPKAERFELDAMGRPKLVKSRVRYGVVAPAGYVVLVADLSQIEARVVAVLAGQADLVRGFANGEDVYSDCATGLFGRPVSKELAKTDPIAQKDRDAGKFIILGCGFGLGWKKLQRQARKAGLLLSDEEAERYVNYYRERYSKVPELWRTYDAAIRDLIISRQPTTIGPVTFEWLNEQARTAGIRGPNGLHLIYPRLRMEKDTNERWQVVCNQARDKFPRKLWGGSITENIVQRLARDVMVEAMLSLQRELGLRTALQVYDEIVTIAPETDAPALVPKVAEIMCRPVPWMPNLPIGTEVTYGPSYGDC